MDSPIDEIKQRLDIVDVVSSYIKLEKCGANYRARCPFHSEKKPSFFVSPARQIWRCFGCGLGGSVFDFVKQIEGVEFGDALRILAKRAGVELKKQDPRLKTERKRLYDICELGAKFFEKQLSSQKGKEAKKYILSRGINEESIKEWRIGYSPDVWDGLLEFLKKKGYEEKEIERTGLVVRNEKGKVYDRFRGRIIFPVFDLNSQVVGFGGRIFDKEDVAKYMNTINTPLYDKSKIVYGLDKSKVDIRRENQCILAEGYTDVIMSHQAGVKNIIATSGTALTPCQLSVLKRYTDNLATAFDMDLAGDSATKRGIDLAQEKGFNIRIITMPQDSDPAEVARNPKEWKELIKKTKTILEFFFESAFSKYDSSSAEGKKEISKILLPVIKRIPNRIELSHWVAELAKRLRIPESAVEEEMEKYVEGRIMIDGNEEEEIEKMEEKTREERLEERILSLIIKKPEILKEIDEIPLKYFSSDSRIILEKIKENDVESLKKIELEEGLNEYFNYLFLRSEIIEDREYSLREIKEEITTSLEELQILGIKKELDSISQQIRKFEQEKNSKEVEKFKKEFNILSQELVKLNSLNHG